MKLFDYYRSSAAYRVRIGLNLKGLSPERHFTHLRLGEQKGENYLKINPQGLVPTLETDGTYLTQSLAILEYLDEIESDPPLLPATPLARARVRSLAQLIACDIHPLNNLRVLHYLKGPMGQSQATVDQWVAHWIEQGFAALETRLAREPETGRWCHGDSPGLADCVLVPQLYNARRFNVALDPYPTLLRLEAEAAAHPAFVAAHPAQQPDAEA
ncbi:maleylacetoacetate isomerase [Elstera litoralis]|uniref:Maleylacetoacetate isomerase n=1 Tax=Elstera litoralis TaxID=552518 RepID=A0A0F3INT7_9PROT|nr:maleylacetoacetate isomerase [Elstera litoralis]KJV08282.1 maleylacetoacetate isomerase [Elstera litoralis]